MNKVTKRYAAGTRSFYFNIVKPLNIGQVMFLVLVELYHWRYQHVCKTTAFTHNLCDVRRLTVYVKKRS